MSNHEVFIHPTAIVDSQAKLGIGVSIGPYSIIGAEVELGDHCKVHSHVVLDGKLIVGHDNSFFQFASIGAPPQDHSYKNDPTRTQ